MDEHPQQLSPTRDADVLEGLATLLTQLVEQVPQVHRGRYRKARSRPPLWPNDPFLLGWYADSGYVPHYDLVLETFNSLVQAQRQVGEIAQVLTPQVIAANQDLPYRLLRWLQMAYEESFDLEEHEFRDFGHGSSRVPMAQWRREGDELIWRLRGLAAWATTVEVDSAISDCKDSTARVEIKPIEHRSEWPPKGLKPYHVRVGDIVIQRPGISIKELIEAYGQSVGVLAMNNYISKLRRYGFRTEDKKVFPPKCFT